MQVNTTKHQTWHSDSPTKQNVNKSYHITTEGEDEYEDDMYEDTEDEYTEDEYTEDEDTEDEYTEDEYTEEEDPEDEYKNSVFYRKRGPGHQGLVENQLAYLICKGKYTEDESTGHLISNTEDENPEDEFKEEYNNSVYFRKRGQDTQEWLENYRAYHSGNQSTKQERSRHTGVVRKL